MLDFVFHFQQSGFISHWFIKTLPQYLNIMKMFLKVLTIYARVLPSVLKFLVEFRYIILLTVNLPFHSSLSKAALPRVKMSL